MQLIRVAKINVYIKLMARLGFSAKQVLAKTNLDPSLLTRPDSLVTLENYYAVITNMLRLTGKPDIAFSLGEFIEISDFGILGYAMLSSTTVGQMIRIRLQYQSSMFGTVINIHSAKEVGSGFEMTVSSTGLTETLRRFETEEFLVEGVRLLKIMTGIDAAVRSISFSYAQPPHVAAYRAFFNCPMEFGAPQTTFRFQNPDYDTPIPSGNEELNTVCAQHCQQVMQTLPNGTLLKNRLRDLFLSRPGSLPDIQAAASSLGLSERHLRRKLQADGLKFQELRDEFRFDLARELLVSGRLAQKEVAYLLGYSGSSAFCRAFKLWTGKTIKQFMTEAAAQPS